MPARKLAISDDYADLLAGAWRFYFGYEELVAGKTHQDEYGYDDWAFVAWYAEREVYRLPRLAVCEQPYPDEPYLVLLCGIGHLIERGMLDARLMDSKPERDGQAAVWTRSDLLSMSDADILRAALLSGLIDAQEPPSRAMMEGILVGTRKDLP